MEIFYGVFKLNSEMPDWYCDERLFVNRKRKTAVTRNARVEPKIFAFYSFVPSQPLKAERPAKVATMGTV